VDRYRAIEHGRDATVVVNLRSEHRHVRQRGSIVVIGRPMT